MGYLGVAVGEHLGYLLTGAWSTPSASTATTPCRRGRSSTFDGERIVVAAGGGAVAILIVRANGEKTAAGDYARATGVEAGARLGSGERSAA